MLDMRPLVAIDLNSNIDYLVLFKFINNLLRKFKDVDITFIVDDGKILEFDNNEVFKISDSYSTVELVRDLKSISDKSDSLKLGSLLKLKRELGRSIVILVSDRKVKSKGELIFVFDGKRIRLLKGN
ncbi:hypothetical protein GFB69_01835 [Acidianus ambivalens]|uniref:Uncharacterized protein n=2 Tax=Acidianus ambivalens TaxID=2283 RepID=A0A650CXB0_ACIAM|nr:hypothetical protein [Acidianus ambivalens]QGR22335.1 hypothetical protein D1866_10395 [Acidianus ambivalens]